METIVHNIRDLSGVERSAVERLVGHALGENQQAVIQVVSPEPSQPAATTSESSPEAATPQLPDYCNVYDGMSDEELAELESRILDRSPSRSTSWSHRQPTLLDTDTLSEILKKKNAQVLRHAGDYLARHQRFAISAMTRYEVLRGLKDMGALGRIQEFERFCRHAEIFPASDEILVRAADLWVDARRGGRPRYDADLIFAATAIEHGRILATGNTAHFAWIPGLTLADWRQP